jgi:hypothetical protein
VPLVDFGQFKDNPTGAATAFQNAQAQLSNNQNAARTDVFNQYTNAVNNFGSTADNYNKLASAYGVPAYQQTMNNLQYAISHLRDDVHSRTMGYNVSDPQANELYAKELTPLSQNLSDVGREYNTATGNIDKLLQYQAQDQATQLKPLEAYISSLDTSFANQNSAFATAANAGLTGIQNQTANQLAQNTFAQNVKQFGLTYALDQQKQADSNNQFAQTFGLDTQKYQASVDQFNQTHTLEEQKFNQAAQQFAQTFGLQQLQNQQQVAQFAQTYGLDVQKFQQAADQFAQTFGLQSKQFAEQQVLNQQAAAQQQWKNQFDVAAQQQKAVDDAAKNALYQAQIDKIQSGITSSGGFPAPSSTTSTSPSLTPDQIYAATNGSSFASGLANFAYGGILGSGQ